MAITKLQKGTPYQGKHVYNNDHDLASLTIASYFGADVEIGNSKYADVFEYIQTKFMTPVGIRRRDWYFLGTLSRRESPAANSEVVSLTVRSVVFLFVRGL